jgi:hypothetical protein
MQCSGCPALAGTNPAPPTPPPVTSLDPGGWYDGLSAEDWDDIIRNPTP